MGKKGQTWRGKKEGEGGGGDTGKRKRKGMSGGMRGEARK